MMRNFLIAFVFILLFSSCTSDEELTEKLEDYWQLTEMWKGDEVEYHDDLFYGFQNTLIQIERVYRGIENSELRYYGRYECEGDSIFFALFSGGETVDPVLRLEQELISKPYVDDVEGEYINRFKIEKFTGSQMIWMRGDDERFVFRKY